MEIRKKKDDKNRWRNKTISFRVSPEEATKLDKLVELSGLTKQDYIVSKLADTTIMVYPSPRILKALQGQIADLSNQLQEIPVDSDNLQLLQHITTMLTQLNKKEAYDRHQT